MYCFVFPYFIIHFVNLNKILFYYFFLHWKIFIINQQNAIKDARFFVRNVDSLGGGNLVRSLDSYLENLNEEKVPQLTSQFYGRNTYGMLKKEMKILFFNLTQYFLFKFYRKFTL